MGAFGSFNHILSAIASIKGPLSEIEEIFSDENKHFIFGGSRLLDGLKIGIDIKNLSFSFPGRDGVLSRINTHIVAGETTAIVGSTGSGKTTFVNVLMRYYDFQGGQIMFDGNDIKELDLKSLRSHISIVSQEVFLFNDTFKNNLIYGLEIEPSDETITDILQKSKLSDLIAKLPQGLNTEIGDRGVQLSGGEKQRLSIARAMLKGSEIIIFDEATSALDTKTERQIQEAIDEAIKNRTAIVIAHRLSTIQRADKILVLDNGRLIEEGALDDLLAKKGKFYELWNEQKFF